jgi:hypothetical protein
MSVFVCLCLSILLDHHDEGIQEASPSYIAEKLEAFENSTDEDAWCALDIQNKGRVVGYCRRWSYPISQKFIDNYIEELQMSERLGL